MNLSSLIDLPPSAFNSSFPPPVVLDKKNECCFIYLKEQDFFFVKIAFLK